MSIITISRGSFTGGKAVAEALSAKLGYPCISKEIIFDAADEFGIPEEKLVATFEKPPKSWKQTPSKRIDHLSYVRYELLKRAKNEDLVFHGYAGHLLLGDISHVIRVRVIADMEYRIRIAMEKDNLTRKEAFSIITKQDKQSRKWVKFLYGIDWEHPSLYDVVINLERTDIEGAVAIIEKMTQLDHFKHTAASRKAFNDQLLNSRVWAALIKDERTCSSNVRITANNGEIAITGNIDSEQTIDAIQTVAMQVEGVKQVNCEIDDISQEYRVRS